MKAYTADDLWNMVIPEAEKIRQELSEKVKGLLNEGEQKILDDANDILSAPYSMAVNPYEFDMNKQAEAQMRKQQISGTLYKASVIRARVLSALTHEERVTLNSISQIQSGRYANKISNRKES